MLIKLLTLTSLYLAVGAIFSLPNGSISNQALQELETISLVNSTQIIEQITLEGDKPWMSDMEFSPDGTALAVVETDSAYEGFKDIQGTVHIWDTSTWQEEMTLSSDGLSAMSLAFDPDDDYLAVGNTTGEIQLWDLNVQRVDATLTGHNTWVNALAYGPGGGLLISGSGALYASDTPGDSTVRLWLTSSGSEEAELFSLVPVDAQLGAGLSASFSPDGGIVAAGMTNGTVHLWAVESKRELAILDEYAWAHELIFTPDSSQILFAADDGVRVWNVEDAIETFGYIPEYKLIAPLADEEFIFSIALNPDGQILAAGYQDGTVRLWDINTGDQLTVLEGHEGRVVSLAFSPDGTLLASGGTDGTVRLWGVPAEN